MHIHTRKRSHTYVYPFAYSRVTTRDLYNLLATDSRTFQDLRAVKPLQNGITVNLYPRTHKAPATMWLSTM